MTAPRRRVRAARGETLGDGSAVLVVLLLLGLLVLASVAWQAQDAARSHRAVAEAVLRDYATLAADELVRRVSQRVGYGGYRLLQALRERGDEMVAPAALGAQDPRLADAATLASCVFRLAIADPPATALPRFGGPAPASAVIAWLSAAVPPAARAPSEADAVMAAVHATVEGVEQRAVFLRPGDGGSEVLGFLLARPAVAAAVTAVLDEPLLPPSLGGGRLAERDDGYLELRLDDDAGVPLFQASAGEIGAPADRYAPRMAVERPFGDAYGGLLAGWTVRAALDPEAAPLLVIGGLPRSRLPILLGLLLLAALLAAVAMVQLRRARRLARMRTDFVSQVSHELRTPLTQIRMFAETLLLGRVRSAEERRRSLEIIDREARRLGHLVENVLQFSRGERGVIELARAPRELAPLVRELIEELTPLAAGRGVRLRCELIDGVLAEVDAGAWHQVVLNLLDNAIKYGPDGQEVTVTMELVGPAGETVRLAVEDQGPGVPRRERQRIWRSYRRLERDRAAAIAGTGIGLAVVRELIALHGGRAWCEEGAAGGARFVVELARARVEHSAPAAGEAPP